MLDLRRRQFITLLGGAAAVWPLAARAQRPAKVPIVGYLGSSTASAQSQWVAAFVQRLHDLGWIEGRTIAIEYRWAEGRTERFQEIAGEFARLKVDVIVTSGTAPALWPLSRRHRISRSSLPSRPRLATISLARCLVPAATSRVCPF